MTDFTEDFEVYRDRKFSEWYEIFKDIRAFYILAAKYSFTEGNPEVKD